MFLFLVSQRLFLWTDWTSWSPRHEGETNTSNKQILQSRFSNTKLGLFFRVTKGSKVNLVNQEDKDTRWRPASYWLVVIGHVQPKNSFCAHQSKA